jgi:hypothetical protein
VGVAVNVTDPPLQIEVVLDVIDTMEQLRAVIVMHCL